MKTIQVEISEKFAQAHESIVREPAASTVPHEADGSGSGELVATDGEHTTVRESIGGQRRRVLRVRGSVMAASPSTEWSNGPA